MNSPNNDQFNLNMDTIAAFAGLRSLEKQTKECPICDCIDGHECIICSMEIGEKSCQNREGHCIDCYDAFQWSLKN